MSLVPIIQPPIMRALTTKRERAIVMPTPEMKVSKVVKILFPVVAGVVTILIAPMGAPLMGMLMLGNFLKESGVVQRLVDVSTGALTNLVTLFLGLTIGASMMGGNFLRWQTILVFGLGLVAISLDTVTGVLLGKLMCLLSGGQDQPAAGRGRYLGLSHVLAGGAAGGAAGQPAQLPAVPRDRRQYGRPDRLGNGRGHHAGHPERARDPAAAVREGGSPQPAGARLPRGGQFLTLPP